MPKTSLFQDANPDIDCRECDLHRQLFDSCLLLARTLMYDTRYDDALSVVESQHLRQWPGNAPLGNLFEIEILEAEILQRKHRDSGIDQEPVMVLIDDLKSRTLESGECLCLGQLLKVKAKAIMERELAAGRSYDAALKPLERALELFEEADGKVGIAQALFSVGLVYEFRRESGPEDKAKAAKYHTNARQLAADIGDRRIQSYAARHLAGVRHYQSDVEDALALYEESLALREQLGYRGLLPGAYDAVAAIHLEMGHLDEAQGFIQQTKRWSLEKGFQRYVLLAELRAGEVLEKQGHIAESIEHYTEALKVGQETGFQPGIEMARVATARLQQDAAGDGGC
ncbi:hypothetical protein ACFLSZ_04090 [Candidatus Bipolaricaulota bacterium]